jgi:peptidoglycan/xylan/chitin deacetylase (PgdA/CDA1 family)
LAFLIYNFVANGDSLDWKNLGCESEIKQVLEHKHLGNGSILLFHNDAKFTPEVLDTIIKKLKADGYEIVLIRDMIYKDGYTINSEGRQIKSMDKTENKQAL